MRAGTRETRPVLRTLGLTAAIALMMALVPGLASAQTAAPDARGTSAVCDGSYQSNFDDIAGSAHEGNIRCMADYGLTEGLRGGTNYGPRLDVNRGQMASFVARFIEDYNDEDLPAGSANRFNDVPSSYVHARNINKLAAIGVVEGTSASAGQSYAPNAGVTRAQMGSFIRRALSYLDNGQVNPLSAPPPAAANYFPDIAGSVHQANINAIAGVGIVQGFADGTYRPNDLVKRDQMASFIMRAYDYAVTEDLGEPVGPRVNIGVTAPTDPVEPGANVTVTFGGDVDRIATVTVAGDCIEDGAVTVGEGGTASFAVGAETPDGDCVLTFLVTFDDGTTQSVPVTFPVQAPPAPSVTITADDDDVAPGGNLAVTFAGNVDRVQSATVAGDCVEDGAVTIGEGGIASLPINEAAEDGNCELTFTVNFDDGSTQPVPFTVVVRTPAPDVQVDIAGPTAVEADEATVYTVTTGNVGDAAFVADVTSVLTFTGAEGIADGDVTLEVRDGEDWTGATLVFDAEDDGSLTYTIDRPDVDLAPGADLVEEFRVTFNESGVYTFTYDHRDGEGNVLVEDSTSITVTEPPAEFTMFVEAGGIVIGTGDDAFTIDFAGCPGGVPAEPQGECITFAGVIDGDGNFTIQPEGVFFPSTVIQVASPFGPLNVGVNTGVDGPISGTIDADTGVADFDLPLVVDLDIGNNDTADCRVQVGLDGTTGTSGGVTGSVLDEGGQITVVDGQFAISGTTVLSPAGESACGLVDGAVGLPSPGGQNTATFDLLLVQNG